MKPSSDLTAELARPARRPRRRADRPLPRGGPRRDRAPSWTTIPTTPSGSGGSCPALALMEGLGRSPASGDGLRPPDPTGGLGVLGDFRILREVGRGGMGVVYEAVQISLGRRVALKVLPFAAALDPRHLARFRVEAQAAALLHHAHIVPIHAVGCDRGVHYYAMQFIDGRTLAELIADLRRGRDGPERDDPAAPTPGRRRELARSAATLGLQAAEALEHAHGLGVIHRDVKPANLLVDAAGTLWVADFGLARLGDRRRPHAVGPRRRDAPLHDPRAGPGPARRGRRRGPTSMPWAPPSTSCSRSRPAFDGEGPPRRPPAGRLRGADGPAIDRPVDPARPGDDRPEGDGQGAGVALRRRPASWPTTSGSSSTTGRSAPGGPRRSAGSRALGPAAPGGRRDGGPDPRWRPASVVVGPALARERPDGRRPSARPRRPGAASARRPAATFAGSDLIASRALRKIARDPGAARGPGRRVLPTRPGPLRARSPRRHAGDPADDPPGGRRRAPRRLPPPDPRAGRAPSPTWPGPSASTRPRSARRPGDQEAAEVALGRARRPGRAASSPSAGPPPPSRPGAAPWRSAASWPRGSRTSPDYA